MDDLGPISVGIAGVVVFQLVGHALGWRLEVMIWRATQIAFAVLLFILAGPSRENLGPCAEI
jgi:hypothetical protein